jgi:inorganic pyrophosphatase
VPEFDRLEIQHFFEVYKALEPGKWVMDNTSWVGRADAEAQIRAARKLAAERGY